MYITGALNLTHEEFHSRVSPMAISNVACVGTENELMNCSHSHIASCDPINDAGVVCQGRIVEYDVIMHVSIYFP